MRASAILLLCMVVAASAVTNELAVTNNRLTVTGNTFAWKGSGGGGGSTYTNYAAIVQTAGDWGLFENTPTPWVMGHDSNYTVSVWAQWHTWTAWAELWSYQNSGGGKRRNMDLSDTPGTFRFFHYGYGATYSQTIVTTNYATGVWYHVAVVHEDDDDVLAYINGELAFTGNITDSDWHDDGSEMLISLYSGPGANCANGMWLDEFCIYDSALSAGTVAAKYASQRDGTNETSAAYIYHMDENSSSAKTNLFAATNSTAAAQTLHGTAVLEWRARTAIMGPPTPPPPDKVVTGTISPDATGDYYADGDYCGQTSYKNGGSTYYVWFDGYMTFQWYISTGKGYGAPPDGWTSGSGPNGDYTAVGETYTGTATVANP